MSQPIQAETDRLFVELEGLVAGMRGDVESIIHPYRLPGVSAEDILQDAWMSLLHAQRATLLPENDCQWWLRTVVRNCAFQAIRSARAIKNGGRVNVYDEGGLRGRSSISGMLARVPGGGKTPSMRAVHDEITREMRDALMHLPSGQRKAVELHCLDELSRTQTAALLNRSPQAIRDLVRRGLRELRRLLALRGRFSSADDGRYVALRRIERKKGSSV